MGQTLKFWKDYFRLLDHGKKKNVKKEKKTWRRQRRKKEGGEGEENIPRNEREREKREKGKGKRHINQDPPSEISPQKKAKVNQPEDHQANHHQ